MKHLSAKIVSSLMVLLIISTTQYFLPILVSLHGNHTFVLSFDGNVKRILLNHSNSDHDHTHNDSDNHHSHDEDDNSSSRKQHQIIGEVHQQVKTTSEFQFITPIYQVSLVAIALVFEFFR